MDNREQAHRAKMKRKAERVLVPGFTPMDDKRFRSVRMSMAMQGRMAIPNIGRVTRSKNDDPAYRKPFARIVA